MAALFVVACLAKLALKFRREGMPVGIVGMNEARMPLMDRFGIHDKPDGLEQLLKH